MIEIVRCSTAAPEFVELVRGLDADLRERYGALQDSYAPHNKVDTIETAVVAREHGRAVGCGCFKQHPHGESTIELKRMYVAPAARGRRIGTQIVGALEQWGRELGFSRAVLETGDRQHEAIALYTRCGYARTPNFPPYDALPASVCMRKNL
jgi:GNAT superfamily N-acetyltransferase